MLRHKNIYQNCSKCMLQIVLHATQPMCHAILQTCYCNTHSCCAQASFRHWNVQPAMPSRCTRLLIDLVLQRQLQLPVVNMTSHSSTQWTNNKTLSPNRSHVVLLNIICDGICLRHTALTRCCYNHIGTASALTIGVLQNNASQCQRRCHCSHLHFM